MFFNQRIQWLLCLTIFFLITEFTYANQQISAVCKLGGGTKYELYLKLNANNIDSTEQAIMKGSYIGLISDSPVDNLKEPPKEMAIRGTELAKNIRCLNDKLSAIQLPTEFFQLPTQQIKIPNYGNPENNLATQKVANINLDFLQNELVAIAKLFQQNEKKVAFHKLGKLTVTINNIKSDDKTIFQGKEELVNRHNSIITQYFEDGMLRCENNRSLIKLETSKDLPAGKVLRHILNLLCVENMTWNQPFIAYALLLDITKPVANSQILALFERAIHTSNYSGAEQKLSARVFSLLDESKTFTFLKNTYTDLLQVEETDGIDVREALLSNTVEVMFATHQVSQSDYKTTMKEILKQWLQ